MKPLLALFALLLLAGCVYDSADDCPTGVRLRLWSQTACATEPSYPEVSVVRFFAFGADGLLAATVDDVGAVLGENYRLPLDLQPGTYTLLVWCRLGVGAGYNVVEPVVGETTRESLILELHHSSGKLEGVNGLRLWTGTADNVVVDAHRQTNVGINLTEETNRVSVEVDNFSRPNDLSIEVVTHTGSMKYSGAIEPLSDPLALAGRRTQSESAVIELFTMLQLEAPAVRATGSRTLVITDADDGSDLFRGDLEAEILARNPAVNLGCTNDFAIRFVMGELPDGTNVVFQIWVNEWLVHSYENEL